MMKKLNMDDRLAADRFDSDDEHAHIVKALRQLNGVLAESRLKILDLNVRSGNMLVKAGLVVGFRIKKCKLHDCIAPP